MLRLAAQRFARRGAFAAAAAAGAGLATAAFQSTSTSSELAAAPSHALPTIQSWHSKDARSLPVFSKAEVAKHASLEDGSVWVIFRGGVYDITEFIKNHPGGVDKILSAAGQSVEPFWSLYRQHVQPASAKGAPPVPKDHVQEILAPLQIGWLDPAEAAAAAATRSDDDPYRHEPDRHPALKVHSETPCSAETPAHLLGDAYLTPNALWYVRNHHPVPPLSEKTFTLEVCEDDATDTAKAATKAATATGAPASTASTSASTPRSYTLAQLRAMPRTTITASLQCGGNRRSELNTVRKTSGLAWGLGAMSTAQFTGVRLRDVLLDAGVVGDGRAAHVQFEGVDGTKASIPIEKAIAQHGDVLLAYEMNGEELPPDHGYPLRVIVPGHVGVRNIKWVKRIVASREEADGVWQRGMAYKAFGPDVTSLDGIDLAQYVFNPILLQTNPTPALVAAPPSHKHACIPSLSTHVSATCHALTIVCKSRGATWQVCPHTGDAGTERHPLAPHRRQGA